MPGRDAIGAFYGVQRAQSILHLYGSREQHVQDVVRSKHHQAQAREVSLHFCFRTARWPSSCVPSLCYTTRVYPYRIALNLASRLNDHLSSGPCEVFIAAMKVIVDPVVSYYPDVVVTRDPPDGDPYVRTQPHLIIAVVSPSTERIDRHEKACAYRRVPSLQEYVLVLQDRMQVEVYRRQSGAEWKPCESQEAPCESDPDVACGVRQREDSTRQR